MATITKKFKIGLSKADIERIKQELGQIEVDTSLDTESDNPIANSVVAGAIDQLDTDVNKLESDVLAINAAQNLLDIVADYDALMEYTGTLLPNDKIKVLNDENYDNQASYYRWTGTNWEFIALEPVPKIEVANEITEGSEELVTAGLVFDFVNDKINEEITSALNADYTIGGEV